MRAAGPNTRYPCPSIREDTSDVRQYPRPLSSSILEAPNNMASKGLQRTCVSSRSISAIIQCQYRPQLFQVITPVLPKRTASGLSKAPKNQKAKAAEPAKKRKDRNDFLRHSLKDAQQFALCDAMRYSYSAPTVVSFPNSSLGISVPSKSADHLHPLNTKYMSH